ncbi:MAG: hypothetical protein ACRDRK_13000 [Pseudonocardia sp.]
MVVAHTTVFRVVEILHTTTTLDGRPRLMTGRLAYRWTRQGAERLRDRWAREASAAWSHSGFTVQAGIVHWIPDDEWDAAVEATEWGRDQNVDDRAEHGPAVTWTKAWRKGQAHTHSGEDGGRDGE